MPNDSLERWAKYFMINFLNLGLEWLETSSGQVQYNLTVILGKHYRIVVDYTLSESAVPFGKSESAFTEAHSPK